MKKIITADRGIIELAFFRLVWLNDKWIIYLFGKARLAGIQGRFCIVK